MKMKEVLIEKARKLGIPEDKIKETLDGSTEEFQELLVGVSSDDDVLKIAFLTPMTSEIKREIQEKWKEIIG